MTRFTDEPVVLELDPSQVIAKRRGQGWRNQKYDNREFIAWDGEGWTEHSPLCTESRPLGSCVECAHHYCLFGSSDGTSVEGSSLSTLECLRTILDVGSRNPHAIHIGFAFQYDVNMILRDLPPKYIKKLKDNTFVHWKGYRLEHIPKKWFTVSGIPPDGGKRISVRIQDVFSFFACSFVKALRGWNVGTDEEIRSIEVGKESRGGFRLDQLDSFVRPYWDRELKLLVQLGNRLRSILYSAELRITSWYGPGNIASFLYKRENTARTMDKQLPREIIDASAYAYAGGRFEAFKAGVHGGDVYSADINSAYPYAMSMLPNLDTGNWVHIHSQSRNLVPPRSTSTRLGLYRIAFVFNSRITRMAREEGFPLPVFHRRTSGQVWYPEMSEGWYHAPEAQLLFDAWHESGGKAFSHFELMEAWVYEDDGTYPFRWVSSMYNQRAVWKSQGNPAQLALKLGINSLYGKLAQRIGHHDGESPTWHQLEWAGHITSHVRAMLYNAMKEDWQHVIAVETDGIYSTRPLSLLETGRGKGLGQWECDTYSGIIFLQNGVYWLKDNSGNWLAPKSRGIPQKQLSRDAAVDALVEHRDLVAFQHQFIGYGTALHRDIRTMRGWRTWVTAEKRFEFGGNGKRFHDPETCGSCLQNTSLVDGLHTLSLRRSRPNQDNFRSSKHALPWLDELYDGVENLKHDLRWEIIGDV